MDIHVGVDRENFRLLGVDIHVGELTLFEDSDTCKECTCLIEELGVDGDKSPDTQEIEWLCEDEGRMEETGTAGERPE